MGYSHYWKATKVDATEYQAALKDIAKIVTNQKSILAGPNGEPKTKPITNDGISFNGIDEDSHETFDLPAAGLKDFDFCKTAQKPYDTVVTACLARLAEVKGVKVTSDGNMGEWEAGVALASKVLGRPVVNPCGPKLAEAGFLGKVAASSTEKECSIGYAQKIKHHYEVVAKKHTDPSLKPPKAWWEKMKAKIAKSNPDYSAAQVKKTIGNIWFNDLTDAKRKEIRGREGKKYGKAK